jgi:E3 ubiquitin-protein ligase RGLG
VPARAAPAGGKRPRLERKYSRIVDQYRSLDEVIEALAQAGLESSNLIIGIDFTKSNEWTGSLCELICKERKHLFLDLDT